MNARSKNCSRVLFLFLIMWGLYGCVTNLWDQYGYNLMHAGVEALAERGHFYLEGSATPKFASLGRTVVELGRDASSDVFWRDGHLYPTKQPGMFFIGALAYKPLSLLGITYEREYNPATALVSWLTSGLVAALVVALLFSQSLGEGLSLHSALIVALSLGLASMFFPYSGVLHHDLLGACFLYFAYFLILRPGAEQNGGLWRGILSGFFAGFAFTTSALAGLFLLPFIIALLWARRWRALLHFAIGGIIGILPLLIYDWAAFGNPFLLANSAGRVSDTGSTLSLRRFGEKFLWYFISPHSALWTYAPAFYFAAAGLLMRAIQRKRDSVTLLGGTLLLVLYILSIPTYGGATFGPRYLLLALPLLAVGFIPLLKWTESPRNTSLYSWRRVVWVFFGISFCAGVTVCFSGALRGTMYGMAQHPFIYRLTVGMGLSGIKETPGAFPLLYPIIILSTALFYFLPKRLRCLIFYRKARDSASPEV